jgi:hypothetical protein
MIRDLMDKGEIKAGGPRSSWSRPWQPRSNAFR